jgi:hypothetical protein
MKIFEITQPANVQAPAGEQQPLASVAPAPAPAAPHPAQTHPIHKHKRTDGDYEIEDVWVPNPNFNPDDDESSEELSVTVTFNIEGENHPATWGYNGGDPAEYAGAEIMSAYDENGVDIWDDLDPKTRDRIQMEADEKVQEIINDSGDDYDYDPYDESVQLEAIKKLSGLK